MKRIKLSALLAIAVTGSSLLAMTAEAAVFRYRASGDWTLITDGATPGWGPNPVGVGTTLPGGSDDARINFGNNTVTVTSNVPTVNRVQIGVDESGQVVVANGGTLSSNGDVLAGNNNSNATGSLTIQNGGTVNVGNIFWSANNSSNGVVNIQAGGVANVASHLWWGVTGTSTVNINGTLNQTGGILGLGTNNASTATGGTATVTIGDDGVLNLNNISSAAGLPSIQAGSVIDITGTGQIRLAGDFEGVLNDYVDANKIIGEGINDNANLVVDQVLNPGFTTVYLVPEPTSLALLGLGGLMVMRRRRAD